ncbi:MAG: hypothetical protein WCK67_10090 [bacterium]
MVTFNGISSTSTFGETKKISFLEPEKKKEKSIFDLIGDNKTGSILGLDKLAEPSKSAASKKNDKPKAEKSEEKATTNKSDTESKKNTVKPEDLKVKIHKDLKGVDAGFYVNNKQQKVLTVKSGGADYHVPITDPNADLSKIKIEKGKDGKGFIVKVPTGDDSWNEITLNQAREKATRKGSGWFGIPKDEEYEKTSNVVNIKAKKSSDKGKEETIYSATSMNDDKGKVYSTLKIPNAKEGDENKGTVITHRRNDNQKTLADRLFTLGQGAAEASVGAITTGAGIALTGIGAVGIGSGLGAPVGIAATAGGLATTAAGATVTGDGLGRMASAFQDDGGKYVVDVNAGGNAYHSESDDLNEVNRDIKEKMHISSDTSQGIEGLTADQIAANPYYGVTYNFLEGIQE